MARIFDRFYQTDRSHTTEGNGLGLALVKQIGLLLGATVKVESAVGKGSTFLFALPKKMSQMAQLVNEKTGKVEEN